MSELSVAATWIYETLAGDATLVALIASAPGRPGDPGIYDEKAEQGAAFPLVLFQDNNPEDVLGVGARRLMQSGEWLVRVVGQTRSYESLVTIADRIDTLLHLQDGSVSGGAVEGCHRERPYRLAYDVEGVEYREMGGFYYLYAKES